jgi:hypothetical protein
MRLRFDQAQLSGFTNFRVNAFLGFQTSQLEPIAENVRRLRFRESVEHRLSGHQTLLDAELEFGIPGPKTLGIDWATQVGNDPQEMHFDSGFRVQSKVLVASATLELERFAKFDFGDWRGCQGLAWQTGNQKREEEHQYSFHASSLNLEPTWSVNIL